MSTSASGVSGLQGKYKKETFWMQNYQSGYNAYLLETRFKFRSTKACIRMTLFGSSVKRQCHCTILSPAPSSLLFRQRVKGLGGKQEKL